MERNMFYISQLTNQTNASRASDFINHSYDYRPNWTPISPFDIIHFTYYLLKSLFIFCLAERVH